MTETRSSIRMEDHRKSVNIYTDGACSGNPGPGGWAAILEFGPHKKESADLWQEPPITEWNCLLPSAVLAP